MATKQEIKSAIKESGLKMREVAGRLGMSTSHLYAMLNGNSPMKTKRQKQIEQLLELKK